MQKAKGTSYKEGFFSEKDKNDHNGDKTITK